MREGSALRDDRVPWLALPADPRSVRTARAFVRWQCDHAGLTEDMRDTAVLLTSELVTNAVVHGRSEVRLEVVVMPECVIVEVGDHSDTYPLTPGRPDDSAPNGRGLAIVEQLATGWGSRQDPAGKVVWFRLDFS